MDQPARSEPDAEPHHQRLSPDEAGQGEIILRSRPQRVVFLLGLILPIGVAAVLLIWYLLSR